MSEYPSQSECPYWELHYSNIHDLLWYVHKANEPMTFQLKWYSYALFESIVTNELPDGKKSHENWLHERIQEDSALKAYWEKYYDPKLYNNATPPFPYEIDVFYIWRMYSGDMAAEDITVLPSDTYKTVVERVLKHFSWMIAFYLPQDWFYIKTRNYKKAGLPKILRIKRYKEWQERIRNKQLDLSN